MHEEGIGIPVLLGSKEIILELMHKIEFEADVEIIDPKSDEQTEKLECVCSKALAKQKKKRNYVI